jgi:SAM-dependent methyltransferase
MTLDARTHTHDLLVCPNCRIALQFEKDVICCTGCSERFGYENGFPDLIVGGRFDDTPDPDLTAYEEECNLYTAQNYFLPTFRRIFSGSVRKTRILSLGCGTGVDVDVLSAAGFEVTGIDCGSRSCAWPERKHRDRLVLANGKHLPFEDNTFDAVYCGCVFPHIGTVGDSHVVRQSYLEERQQFAEEMGRVLRPGGRVVVSSPNRKFPLDIFHGRSMEHPLPRVNSQADPFLLSFEDYQHLFRPADCSSFSLLPVNGYWGFVRRKKRLLGWLSMLPVEATFRLVSNDAFSNLRNTVINPWLVVMGTKALA